MPEFRPPADAPWKTITTPVVVILLVFTATTLWLALLGQQWVWFLDGANLLFHEAGHPIFGLLSDDLMVYGGTLGQLVFPLAVSWHFWVRREIAGTYIGMVTANVKTIVSSLK